MSAADPSNPSRAGLSHWLRALIHMADGLPLGSIMIQVPDGRQYRFKGPQPGPAADMIFHRASAARRFLLGGGVAMAEAFMDGHWETSDLTALLELAALAEDVLSHKQLQGGLVARFINRMLHAMRANTKTRARRNIEQHYDLGNNFYQRWLDPSMTYSSGIYPTEDTDLQAAQEAKYGRITELLDLKPEHHVLEIGCGWGGFAEYAASRYGCRVTGITISPSQLEFAQARIERAQLSHLVELKLIDYRDVQGTYDRITSIEMIEAVGEQYWPTYFKTLNERLKPGGIAAVQAITIADRFFEQYRKSADFIQRHVFPGGMLPSPGKLKTLASTTGLNWKDEAGFARDYAKTLATWRQRFDRAWPEIAQMGFDERFQRLWQYYLSYCEAGFRSGGIDLLQIALVKP
jgi:cyclopropane-fatty-acyl-phospholipid synthase